MFTAILVVAAVRSAQPEGIGSVDPKVWEDCMRAQEELRTTLMAKSLKPEHAVSASLFFVDYGSSGLDRKSASKTQHIATYTRSVPKMIRSMKAHVPGWVFVCFYDSSVPPALLQELIRACETHGVPHAFIKMNIPSYFRAGTFWRYLAADVFNFTYFRDIELPFSEWDLESINDFEDKRSEMLGYVQCVHQRTWIYQRIIQGGLFMAKKGIDMNSALRNWRYWHTYGADEVFLTYYIHPRHRFVVYYTPKVKKSIEAFTEMAGHETRIALRANFPL